MMKVSQIAAVTFAVATSGLLLSLPAIAQQRICIVDDNNGEVFCGRPATAQEIRQADGQWSNSGRYGNRGTNRSIVVTKRTSNSDPYAVYDALDDIYQDILNRAIDRDGLRLYTSRLNQGWNLARVRSDIATSREAEDRLNDLFQQILSRPIDGGGLKTYRNRLANGWSLRDVERDIRNSREARGR